MTKKYFKELDRFENKPLSDGFEESNGSWADYFDNITKDEKRNAKKAQMLLDEYKEEIDINKAEILNLKRALREKEDLESNIIKTIINVLDEYNYALDFYKKSNNKEVYENLNKTKKIIDKEIMGIGLIEIKSEVGDFMSEEYHNPLRGIEHEEFDKYQIVELVKRGYTYKGKKIREANVVVAK